MSTTGEKLAAGLPRELVAVTDQISQLELDTNEGVALEIAIIDAYEESRFTDQEAFHRLLTEICRELGISNPYAPAQSEVLPFEVAPLAAQDTLF